MFEDRMECPLSKEELLELVEEEARLRVSAGFLQQVFAKLFSSRIFFLNFSSNRFFLEKLLVCLIPFCLFQVELEEREGKTDGTVAIQRMQEELVSRHCLLRFCTKRDRPQRWSIFRAMRCRWLIFQQRSDTDYFLEMLNIGIVAIIFVDHRERLFFDYSAHFQDRLFCDYS